VLKGFEEEYMYCSLKAGYLETGMILLIVGQVVEMSTRMNGPDRVTQFLIGEGYVELTQQYLKSIAPAGYTVEQTIEEIRKQMPNVARGAYTGLNIQNKVLYGYPLTGTPKKMLNEIAEAYNLEWRLDRESLFVTDKAGLVKREIRSAFVLNQDTGLIEIPYYATAPGRKLKEDKKKRRGVQFKALLNGNIFPGDPVRLESTEITGWFKVVSARLYGNYDGNEWYIECFCDEILKEDIPT
jgi:predicted DNA-binding transcriptional regulator